MFNTRLVRRNAHLKGPVPLWETNIWFLYRTLPQRTHEAARESIVPLCEDGVWKPTALLKSSHRGLMRQPTKDWSTQAFCKDNVATIKRFQHPNYEIWRHINTFFRDLVPMLRLCLFLYYNEYYILFHLSCSEAQRSDSVAPWNCLMETLPPLLSRFSNVSLPLPSFLKRFP